MRLDAAYGRTLRGLAPDILAVTAPDWTAVNLPRNFVLF